MSLDLDIKSSVNIYEVSATLHRFFPLSSQDCGNTLAVRRRGCANYGILINYWSPRSQPQAYCLPTLTCTCVFSSKALPLQARAAVTNSFLLGDPRSAAYEVPL